jgi:hypothetical protein
MIQDLDKTIAKLLKDQAPEESHLKKAIISFDIPDAEWRAGIIELTVNCYLYDIRQNLEMRTNELYIQRNPDKTQATWRKAPVRIDCAYCITAWSSAEDESVLEEHRLLSQVMLVLLRNPTLPDSVLEGSLKNQIPPYPTVIVSQDGTKNQPEFWRALDQQLKPSLNYIITLALLLDEAPEELGRVVDQVEVVVKNLDEVQN